MNFIDILIYLVEENSSYFVENYTDILSIVSTIYIGFFAFVYIKLLDSRREIKESLNLVLLEKYNKESIFNRYLAINSIPLIFSVASILLKNVIDNDCIIVLTNLVFVLFDMFYNVSVCTLLEKYLFKKEEILKKFIVNYNINLNKNENDDFDKKLKFIGSEILNEINSNNTNIPYIIQMLEEFKKILNDSKKFLNEYYADKQCSLDDLNLNYYYQVIYEVQHIFYNVVNIGKQNVLSYYFLDFIVLAFEDLTKTTKDKNDNLDVACYYDKIITIIKSMYTLLINSNISNIDVRILSRIYKALLYSKNKDSLYIYIKNPNKLIFEIIKNIIDSNLNDKSTILISFSNKLKDDGVKSLNFFVNNIINLNCSILAYLYFKKDYFLFREYLTTYNQINSIVISSKTFVVNMEGIIKYSVDKNCKIFEIGEKFNDYTYAIEYKYYILFFFFSRIYLCLQKNIENIKFCLKNDDLESLKVVIGKLLSIDYIDQLNIKELFDNIYINININEIIEKYLNNFFENKEFLDIMELNNYVDGIKKFISKKIERMRKKIKEKQKQLITNDINSDALQNVRDNCIKYLQEYVRFKDYDKIKVEDTKEINNNFFYISFEKYYVLTGDYKNSLCARRESYYKIYNDIFSRCKEISNINELQSVDLKNYFIINNFLNCAKYFKNAFPENKYIEKLNDYKIIGNIEINSINIPIYNITDFYMDSNYSILIVKKDSLKLFKLDENVFKDNISFEESDITKNEQLEHCYRKDYGSSKKITIKLPRFIFAKFYEDTIGYRIIVKE